MKKLLAILLLSLSIYAQAQIKISALPRYNGSLGNSHFVPLADSGTNNTYKFDLRRLLGLRTINTTAPLSGGGSLSSDLTLYMPQASSSQDGYAAASDVYNWNNKVEGITFTPQSGGDVTGAFSTSGGVTLFVNPTLTIGNNKITTAKIASSAITSAKIADGNVTNAKLQNSTISGVALGGQLYYLYPGIGMVAGNTYNGNANYIADVDTTIISTKAYAASVAASTAAGKQAALNGTGLVYSTSGTISYIKSIDSASKAFTDSIFFTGTTAPSGATSHTYQWSQRGKVVNYRFHLKFTTGGTSITQVNFSLPSDMPIPSMPSSITGNTGGEIISIGSLNFGVTETQINASSNAFVVRGNLARSKRFQINTSSQTGVIIYVMNGTYFTDN